VLFVVGILIIGRTFYPDNIAETSADGGKKELKTRIYKTDPETATKTVEEVIPTLTTWGGNWNLINTNKMEDSAEIRVEVPVVAFTDDLEVRIKKVEIEGEVKVDVISKSRVGKSDFGENARHVRKILDALDEKFGKAN
jgi:uncharacterized protein (DUF1499 family)